MLRVLMLGVLTMMRLSVVVVAVLAISDASIADELEDADTRSDAMRAETGLALEELDGVDLTESLPSFGEATQRSGTLPAVLFPKLGDELTDPDTLSTIGDLMDNAESLAADLGMSAAPDDGLSIYVFVSFSMPKASLRALITQGELAGVPIVLRGLVNNSVEDTMREVHSLYKESDKQESGAVIDPTLFERFGITQVPSVIVAEYAAGACTPEECPTPDHVKIAGDVPLRYSLDRIALARPDFRHELRAVMKTLEPERQW